VELTLTQPTQISEDAAALALYCVELDMEFDHEARYLETGNEGRSQCPQLLPRRYLPDENLIALI